MSRKMDMDRIFPIWKVENGMILSMQGDTSLAFRFTGPETGTLSAEAFDAVQQALVKAIRVLPSGSVFHKLDFFKQAKVKADYSGLGERPLAMASERHFHERPYLDQESYLILTLKPAGRRLSSSAYSNLLRKSIAPVGKADAVSLGQFMSAVGAFDRIMLDTGLFGLERLSDEELAGDGHVAGLIERYVFLLPQGQQAMLRDVHLKDGIRIGDQHCQMYTLADAADLPSFCGSRLVYDPYSTERTKYNVGFASPLGMLLDCNHVYNQVLVIGDPQQTMKELEAKKLRLQSLSAYSRENAISRDACNDFLNEAITTQKLPVKAHFNVLCWTDDPAELPLLKNKVSSAMAKMNAVCKQETDGAPQLWYASMPGNEADFPMNECFDTFLEQACCFVNVEQNYRSSRSPFGLRLGDRISGVPLQVDISDEPMRMGWITARNKFICGGSGSGKSFFTNHLVRSYYEQQAHVLIVDIGHSYKGLCELLGGYYFTYSEANPICFNPFYLAEGDVLDTEKKESIKTLLLALWKKEDEPYRRSEYVAISNALTLYYVHLAEHPELFPGFNSFYEFLMLEYLEVLENGKVNPRDFDLENFLYTLNPYYKGGEFDFLLNARENLDLLQERFIVFEIDNVKGHPILFPIVTLIIMELYISKMRKLKGVRKVILIEEAWKAISNAGMSEYLKYLFKTVRKFFGEAIVVTQEIEDIISSPIVKQAILNNADCKILLDQRKFQNRFEHIQELLGLTDHDKALVLSLNKANDPKLNYKEVFISLGGHSKVYRTEVSLAEYLCYTTEEREKMMVMEYASRYGSMARGIAVLAAEIERGEVKL